MTDDLRIGAFVGRHHELGLLDESLTAAASGSPRVVLVEGDPGVGKTALVSRFLATLRPGCRVIRASGDEAEFPLTFGVAEQLLRDDGADTATMPQASTDPPNVGAILLDRLEPRADEPVVVVVIDDVHWADHASLRALAFAVRRLRSDPVLAVLTTRPNVPLLEGVERLASGPSGVHVLLDGLDVSELRDLARTVDTVPLAPNAADALRKHTGGNALYAGALLREVGTARLNASVGQPLPAPRRLSTLILARVAACDEATIAFVRALAVLGTAPPDVVAAVADVPDPDAAMSRGIDADLVRLRDGRAGFGHPLIGAAVYHDLEPHARATLHERAAAVVQDRSSRLRHRVAATSGPDTSVATEARDLADEAVGRRDWAAAASAFDAAARMAPRAGERETFELDAAECLLLAGEIGTVSLRLEHLNALSDTAHRRYVLGLLDLLIGRSREAQGLLSSAWDRDPDPGLARRIADQLAILHFSDGRADDSVVWARRALETGREGRSVADGLEVLMVSLALAGRIDDAATLASQLADDADPHTPGFSGAALIALWTDDVERARGDLERVVAAARREGRFLSEMTAYTFLTQAEFRLGLWDDAIAHAQIATSATEDADVIWLASLLNASAVPPHAARGEWDLADAHVAAAISTALTDPQRRFADLAAAVTATMRGDHEAVVGALSGFAGASDTSLEEPGIVAWRDVLAEALVVLGRLDDAEDVLVPLERRASERGLPSAVAAASRARGALESARANHDAAEGAFAIGLEHLKATDRPFDRARLELAYGAHLRRRGRRADAASLLGSARGTLERLRAYPMLERCARELAACGVSTRGPRPSIGLTPQEQAVVNLVRRGMSNREVAAELVVSVRTVEYHLTNAYAKLGVRSRAQLTALELP